MAWKMRPTKAASAMSHKNGLSRGYLMGNAPKSVRGLMVQYNLDQEPLRTGQRFPRVSQRVRAACAAEPFYLRRQMAGWLVLVLIVGVLGAWNLMLLFGG